MKNRYEMYRGPSRGNMRKPRLGTVLLLLWGIFLSLSVYAYLAWLQPSRLAATVSSVLESRLDVQCRIGEVSLSLLPLPTLHVRDLSLLRGSVKSTELHVREAHIRMSYLSLLKFSPVVRSLSLESPTLDISTNLLQSPDKENAQPATFTLPKLPRHIIGLSLYVNDGTFRITGPSGKSSLVCSGIHTDSRLPGLIPGNIDIGVESVRYTLASGLDVSAQDFRFAVSSLRRDLKDDWHGNLTMSAALQLGALDRVLGREISAPYRYFPMAQPLTFALDGHFTASPEDGDYRAKGQADAKALLTMNGHDVPISLTVPFQLLGLQQGMDIREARAAMGDDSLTLSGRMTGLAEGSPVIKGQADIHHFSLTRWFGFGRLMNPGLQHALDDISGSFDELELSLKGVNVPKLRARVQGIELEGSGSCLEFLKPEILISAHAKSADLNRIFPELHGDFPDMSHLPAPVLPLDEDDEEESDDSDLLVKYDIHISADKADIMSLHAGGADVHVIPAPKSGTMLTIAVGDAYGGKATSKVYLQDKIRVTADVSRVSMGRLTRDMAGFSAVSGTLAKGSADLFFLPGSGLTMLSSLGGKVQGSLEDGAFSVKSGASLPYQALTVNAQASASAPKNLKELPPTMDFLGKWNVRLQTKQWSVTADAKQAALAFSTDMGLPVAMRNQPVNLQVSLDKSLSDLLAADLDFSLAGKAGYSIDGNTVSLSDAALRHRDFTLSGNLAVTKAFQKPTAAGRLTFTSSSLKECAALFGLTLPSVSDRKAFKKAEASASVSLSSERLVLDELSGRLDDISFSGKLSQTFAERPALTGSLRFPSLDLEPYLSGDKNGKKNASRSRTPLPLDLLKKRDMELSLTADRVRAFATTLSHASTTVSQKNGVLAAPVKASFPGGGRASGSFQAALDKSGQSVHVSLKANCADVNMLNLSRDRKQKTLIRGTGKAEADLRTVQKNWEDWKHTLEGRFSFLVADGAIISPSSTGQKESTTEFRTMSMSAALSKGVATCRDFLIKGALTTVIGEGTVNLPEESIDARATVTLAGIPEMPLTITGNLFAPKVTYKLLGAVTGTVGNIGSTFVDLVGGVLSAPFKLFMK